MPILAQLALRFLDLSRFIIFLLVFSVSPFLFGAAGKSSVFFVQTLTFSYIFIYATKLCFFDFKPSFVTYLGVRLPFCVFCCFIALVFLQWVGGQWVFFKIIPGTITSYRTTDYLVQLICYVLFFFACLDFFSTRWRVHVVTLLLGIVIILLVFVGYYSLLSQPERLTKIYGIVDTPPDLLTYYSTFINGNHYGGFLVLASLVFVPSILYYLETREPEFQFDYPLLTNLAFLFTLAVIMASIFNADARAALFVQVFVMMMIAFKARYLKHRLIIWGALLAAAAGFLAFLTFSGTNTYAAFFSYMTDVLLYRYHFVKEALGILFRFPLFGTGLGTFYFIQGFYQVQDAGRVALIHPINHNFELLMDTGVVGYLLFMLPLLVVVIASLQKSWKGPSRWCRIYGYTSFTAVVATLIFSSMDDYLRTPAFALLFIVHLAILVKCAHLDIEEDKEGETAWKMPVLAKACFSWRRLTLWIAAIIVLSALFAYGYTAYRAFYLTVEGYRSFFKYETAPRPRYNVALLERALLLRPNDVEAWKRVGDAYMDERKGHKAVQAYQRVVELAPLWSKGWLLMGRARVLAGDKAGGFKSMIHGVRLAPSNRNGYLYLIVSYLKAAEKTVSFEEKRELKKEALKWLAQTYKLPRPLTESDYGYMCNEWIINFNQLCPQLEFWDRELILRLIQESRKQPA